MKKLHKGAVYLVRVGEEWYICRQSSIKGWEALMFTHVTAHKVSYLHGNGVSLADKLRDLNGNEPLEYVICTTDKQLRRVMFRILKTGKPTEELEND